MEDEVIVFFREEGDMVHTGPEDGRIGSGTVLVDAVFLISRRGRIGVTGRIVMGDKAGNPTCCVTIALGLEPTGDGINGYGVTAGDRDEKQKSCKKPRDSDCHG